MTMMRMSVSDDGVGGLRLRAPEPDDVDAMYVWENDAECLGHGGTRTPLSRHSLWEYVMNYDGDIARTGQLRLMICEDGGEGRAVGAVDLTDYDAVNRRASVGIVVDKDLRNRGVAKATLACLCDYASTHLGLHQLWATVRVDNVASVALFRSAGFGITGRLRSWMRVGESFVDAFVFQRLL